MLRYTKTCLISVLSIGASMAMPSFAGQAVQDLSASTALSTHLRYSETSDNDTSYEARDMESDSHRADEFAAFLPADHDSDYVAVSEDWQPAKPHAVEIAVIKPASSQTTDSVIESGKNAKAPAFIQPQISKQVPTVELEDGDVQVFTYAAPDIAEPVADKPLPQPQAPTMEPIADASQATHTLAYAPQPQTVVEPIAEAEQPQRQPQIPASEPMAQAQPEPVQPIEPVNQAELVATKENDLEIAMGDSITNGELAENRGTGGFDPTDVNLNLLDAVNAHNTANGSVTGNNVINASAFQNTSGLVNLIQNSGNNVIIQSATIVNLNMQ